MIETQVDGYYYRLFNLHLTYYLYHSLQNLLFVY